MLVIQNFLRSIDPHHRGKFLCLAVGSLGLTVRLRPLVNFASSIARNPTNVIDFFAGQDPGIRRFDPFQIATAARPCRPDSSDECARNFARPPHAHPAASVPWPPNRANCRCRIPCPPRIISGVLLLRIFHGRHRRCSSVRRRAEISSRRLPFPAPGCCMRTLAKVPRVMTSWLPRREP